MNKYDTQFISVFNVAKAHLNKLEKYAQELEELLPISEETFGNDEYVKLIDGYLFRFFALQDILGRSLFKLCLYKLGEDVFDKSFIDIFNKLEKIGVISDYEKWDVLRNLRNEISHNYDTNLTLNITRINKTISLKNDLTSYFYSIKKYFNL